MPHIKCTKFYDMGRIKVSFDMGLVRFLLLITREARSTLCRSSQTTLSKCFFLLTSSSVFFVVVVVYAMLKATANSRTLKVLNVATQISYWWELGQLHRRK